MALFLIFSSESRKHLTPPQLSLNNLSLQLLRKWVIQILIVVNNSIYPTSPKNLVSVIWRSYIPGGLTALDPSLLIDLS